MTRFLKEMCIRDRDTIKLMHENEANLGASKPAMDLDECERIYLEKKAAREAAVVKGEVR